MAERLQKNTGVIALHISEGELEIIDRVAQCYGVSRSGAVLKAIEKNSLQVIFPSHLEPVLKAQLKDLKASVQIADLESSLVICNKLIEIQKQTANRLSNYQPDKSLLKFFPRRREGITKTTSVRVTPEAVENLRDICWVSGLTMTDVILRLLTHRKIPDRQIAKIKLLFQLAITTLRHINAQLPETQHRAMACVVAFQQTYEKLIHDF